jgi:DNA-binding IscR family transcriptional regulator
VQALEGAIAPMECFVHEHTERVLCSHQSDAGRGCATKLLWTRVQGGIIRSLQMTTLAELVEFSRRSERQLTAARPDAPKAQATASQLDAKPEATPTAVA